MVSSAPHSVSLRNSAYDRNAQAILATMSFFHASMIPIQLLHQIVGESPFASAIAVLASRWAVRFSELGCHVELHPEVRNNVQQELRSRAGRVHYLDRAINTVLSSDFGRQRSLGHEHNLEQHASSMLQIAQTIPSDEMPSNRAIALGLRYGRHVSSRSHYSVATTFLRTFRKWGGSALDTSFHLKSALLDEESVTYASQGKLKVALKLSVNVARSRHQVLGRGHRHTRHSLNNEGMIRYAIGEYNDAAACFRAAGAEVATSPAFADEDPALLISFNNLGLVCLSQGYHHKAKLLFSRSLAGWLHVYGEDDLLVLDAKNNMGLTLCYEGKLQEAETLHTYVYTKRCGILGSQHHETLKSKGNLAMTRNRQGRHIDAEKMYWEVIHDMERRCQSGQRASQTRQERRG
jgi:tetratricopeptide (TPR) repeat protein